jgi:hypothetical protein
LYSPSKNKLQQTSFPGCVHSWGTKQHEDKMKKLFKNFIIVLFACVMCLGSFLCNPAKASDFLCLHYQDDTLTTNTCKFLSDKFGFSSELYSDYSGEKYSIIWLAGFGTPEGFWADSKGDIKRPWGSLVNEYNTDVLIVDACYSGRVFDYETPNNMMINAYSVSANTEEKWLHKGYIASLASMIYCVLTQDMGCKKYIGCIGVADPQVCQMSIILNSLSDPIKQGNALRGVYKYPKYHPNFSIGTVLIDGVPWRR